MMNSPMMNIFQTIPKKMEPVPSSAKTTPVDTAQSATSIAWNPSCTLKLLFVKGWMNVT